MRSSGRTGGRPTFAKVSALADSKPTSVTRLGYGWILIFRPARLRGYLTMLPMRENWRSRGGWHSVPSIAFCCGGLPAEAYTQQMQRMLREHCFTTFTHSNGMPIFWICLMSPGPCCRRYGTARRSLAAPTPISSAHPFRSAGSPAISMRRSSGRLVFGTA